jgi:hypothetical protein
MTQLFRRNRVSCFTLKNIIRDSPGTPFRRGIETILKINRRKICMEPINDLFLRSLNVRLMSIPYFFF